MEGEQQQQQQHPQQIQKGDVVLVQMRRHDTSTNWGFRMQGGSEFGVPLFIQKVNPRSVAGRSGLSAGDAILQICGTSSAYMNHSQAKMEIIRAGNDLDFVIQKGAIDMASLPPGFAPGSPRDERVQIVEEHTPALFNHGYANPNLQSRSFKILQQQLCESEMGGPKPPSVFDAPNRPSTERDAHNQ